MAPSPLRRTLLAAALAGAMALGPAAMVGAQDAPLAEPNPTLDDVVARVLAELGLPPGTIDEVMDDVMVGVAERLDELIDEGIVTPDQVDTLGAVLDDGRFDEVVTTVIHETRERRDAFREAATSVLTDLGVEVPDGVPVHDLLADADLTPDDLARLLEETGVVLPPPPAPPQLPCPDGATRTADGECPPPPPAAPTPQPTVRPTPPPTTTAPPPPPTTQAPPPATGYPETGPATPPPSYPAAGSQPTPPPTYPTPPSGAAVDSEVQL